MTELRLSGVVGVDFTAEDVSNFLKDCSDDLRITIQSEGGKVSDAISIFNQISNFEHKVTTYIEGSALSAGAIIALAGSEVEMAENALMLIHGPRFMTNFFSSSSYTSSELREAADILDKATDVLSVTLKSRLGSDADISNLLEGDNWFTAVEAKEMGLIDTVLPLSEKVADVSNFSNVPDNILAFVQSFGKEDDLMAIKDIATNLGLSIQDGAENSAIEEQIVLHVDNLQTEVKELKDKLDKAKPAAKELPATFVNMAKSYREGRIDGLLKEARISKVVADNLKNTFCDDSVLASCLTEEGTALDNFDEVVQAFNLCEPIVTPGGKTGGQFTDNKEKVSPLVRSAEARSQK